MYQLFQWFMNVHAGPAPFRCVGEEAKTKHLRVIRLYLSGAVG